MSYEEGAKVVPELFMIYEMGKLGQRWKEVEIIWSLVFCRFWKNHCSWYFELDIGIKKN